MICRRSCVWCLPLSSLLCVRKPVFAESMRRVVRAVEASAQTAVPPLPLGGVVFSLGGIKKCPRIMEKLILDPGNPTAKPALDSLDPDGLDASGVRDIVRGMFICASMRHAVAVLEALRVNAEAGHFELVSAASWCSLKPRCNLFSLVVPSFFLFNVSHADDRCEAKIGSNVRAQAVGWIVS